MNLVFYILSGYVRKSVCQQCCIFRWIVKVSQASPAAVAETEGFSLAPPLVTGRSCLATGVELCYSHALFFADCILSHLELAVSLDLINCRVHLRLRGGSSLITLCHRWSTMDLDIHGNNIRNLYVAVSGEYIIGPHVMPVVFTNLR